MPSRRRPAPGLGVTTGALVAVTTLACAGLVLSSPLTSSETMLLPQQSAALLDRSPVLLPPLQPVPTAPSTARLPQPVRLGPVAPTTPGAAGPRVTGPAALGPAVGATAVRGPVVGGPVASGPVASGPAVGGPVAPGPVLPEPVAPGPVAPGPVVASRSCHRLAHLLLDPRGPRRPPPRRWTRRTPQ